MNYHLFCRFRIAYTFSLQIAQTFTFEKGFIRTFLEGTIMDWWKWWVWVVKTKIRTASNDLYFFLPSSMLTVNRVGNIFNKRALSHIVISKIENTFSSTFLQIIGPLYLKHCIKAGRNYIQVKVNLLELSVKTNRWPQHACHRFPLLSIPVCSWLQIGLQ